MAHISPRFNSEVGKQKKGICILALKNMIVFSPYVGCFRSEKDGFALLYFSMDGMWNEFHKYALVYPPIFDEVNQITLLVGAKSSK